MSVEQLQHEVKEIENSIALKEREAQSNEAAARKCRGEMSDLKHQAGEKRKQLQDTIVVSAVQKSLQAAEAARVDTEKAKADIEKLRAENVELNNQISERLKALESVEAEAEQPPSE